MMVFAPSILGRRALAFLGVLIFARFVLLRARRWPHRARLLRLRADIALAEGHDAKSESALAQCAHLHADNTNR